MRKKQATPMHILYTARKPINLSHGSVVLNILGINDCTCEYLSVKGTQSNSCKKNMFTQYFTGNVYKQLC